MEIALVDSFITFKGNVEICQIVSIPFIQKLIPLMWFKNEDEDNNILFKVSRFLEPSSNSNLNASPDNSKLSSHLFLEKINV